MTTSNVSPPAGSKTAPRPARTPAASQLTQPEQEER